MRFIGLLALLVCFSVPAQAQYTTKSKPAAAAVTAQPSARPYQARPTQAARQGSAQTTAPQAQARPAAATSAARVRPQAAAVDEGDSDMPSFEAFQKPAAQAPAAAQTSARPAQRVNPYAVRRQGSAMAQAPAQAQGSAQGSHQTVWPKGEIWVYMSDFEWGDIDGAFVHCEWKAVLQNRTDTTIERLKVSFVVRESYSELTFTNIKPRGADVQGMLVYSDLCPAMQGVKPKVQVLSCRMGDISGSDCSKYVTIK